MRCITWFGTKSCRSSPAGTWPAGVRRSGDQYRVGEAVQALRATDGPFDLIFNDIDKQAILIAAGDRREAAAGRSADHRQHALARRDLRRHDQSAATQGVREFTRLITGDPGWIASLVPLRDGMILAFKK